MASVHRLQFTFMCFTFCTWYMELLFEAHTETTAKSLFSSTSTVHTVDQRVNAKELVKLLVTFSFNVLFPDMI